jgi:hypothetical protein
MGLAGSVRTVHYPRVEIALKSLLQRHTARRVTAHDKQQSPTSGASMNHALPIYPMKLVFWLEMVCSKHTLQHAPAIGRTCMLHDPNKCAVIGREGSTRNVLSTRDHYIE